MSSSAPSNDVSLDVESHSTIEKEPRSLSNFQSRPVTTHILPPDGGRQAWIQVLCAHLTVFNSFGYINSFGVFQPYYVQNLQLPPSDVSWIGSFQILLVYGLGIFSGRFVDAGYFHLTICFGFLFQILAIFTTSASTSYYQLFLSQGLCQGIGNGLLFCPVVTLVTTWFDRKRALALALVACGGGTGGLVFPSIAQSLLFKIGFPWTVRIMGFVMLVNALVVIAFTRTRVQPRKGGSLVEWRALKELPFVLYATGVFFGLWGVFYAFYYVRPFARDVIGVSEYTSFNILLIINGVGIAGRLIPAFISLRYLGPMNTLIPTLVIGSILLFSWIAVKNLTGLFVFVALFGLPGGGIQSLFPAAIASLTDDLSTIGARIGMIFTIASPACLSGPPIAGALIESNDGNYLGAQLFGGLVMAIGAILVAAARTAKVGRTLKIKL